MTKLLALDLSTTCTGYAYEAVDRVHGLQFFVGSVAPVAADYHERIEQMGSHIIATLAENQLEHVVTEDIGLFKGAGKKQNLGTFRKLAELHGVVNYRVRMATGRNIQYLANSTIKSRLGIQQAMGLNRLPGKAEVGKWLKSQGYHFDNDDEADAIALYLAAQAPIKAPGAKKTAPERRPGPKAGHPGAKSAAQPAAQLLF